MTRFAPSFVVALGLIACGGAFGGGGDDDDTGGQAGSGGQGTGGSTSKAGSTGKGGSGASAGTGSGGGGGDGSGCEWMGNHYQDGDSFPAGDGCNTCSCGPNGSVGCTLLGCNDQCTDLEAAYAAAVADARACDPQQVDACSQQITGGLPCGCPTFVNPDQADAIALTEQTLESYLAQACGGTAFCAPCVAPTGAVCSAEGQCVDTFDMPAGVACQVNGTVYPNGTTGVPDPFSCNTCDCVNGELSCTEINCPVACPPETVPSSQCAQCGPVDNCNIVEHGCLPACVDTCQIGACLDGVCRMVCG